MTTIEAIQLGALLIQEIAKLATAATELNAALQRAHAAGSDTVLQEDQERVDALLDTERSRLVAAILARGGTV